MTASLIVTMVLTLWAGVAVPLVGWSLGRDARIFWANAFGTALSPYGSSPQAVWPVPASIAFAGEL